MDSSILDFDLCQNPFTFLQCSVLIMTKMRTSSSQCLFRLRQLSTCAANLLSLAHRFPVFIFKPYLIGNLSLLSLCASWVVLWSIERNCSCVGVNYILSNTSCFFCRRFWFLSTQNIRFLFVLIVPCFSQPMFLFWSLNYENSVLLSDEDALFTAGNLATVWILS